MNELYEWNISTVIQSKFSTTTKVSSSPNGFTTTKDSVTTGKIVINEEVEKQPIICSKNKIEGNEDMVLLSNFLELSMKDKIIQSKEEENQALKKRIAELERELSNAKKKYDQSSKK